MEQMKSCAKCGAATSTSILPIDKDRQGVVTIWICLICGQTYYATPPSAVRPIEGRKLRIQRDRTFGR